MSEFLVEVYVPRATATPAALAVGEISKAAEQLTREGRRVKLLRSIFVPEDETHFYLFEAQSSDAVRETAARAGLRFERVTEAVSEPDHAGAAQATSLPINQLHRSQR